MKNKKNKTLPIIIAVVAIALIGGGIGVVAWRSNQDKTPEVAEENKPAKKRVSVPANVIAISERPYIEVIPFVGREGRSIRIQINNIVKEAEDAEYVLETEVGGAEAKAASGKNIAVPETENPVGLQGAMGEIDIKSFPAKAESLLGSCSAGGACVHYSNLGFGKAQVTFSGGDENYAVASSFNYIENTSRKQATANSKDNILTIIGTELEGMHNYIIANSAGLPAGLTGEIVTMNDPEGGKDNPTVAKAYQVAWTDSKPSKEIKVMIKEEAAGATIYAYDKTSKTWTALETTFANGEYSATDKIADIYALVK
jgi:hypothetical protein